eukprot:354927-Hanusia_phi.AAC.1
MQGSLACYIGGHTNDSRRLPLSSRSARRHRSTDPPLPSSHRMLQVLHRGPDLSPPAQATLQHPLSSCHLISPHCPEDATVLSK